MSFISFMPIHIPKKVLQRLRPLRHRRFVNGYHWWCNNTVCVDQVMWCLQKEKNHQWLLWNVHCVPTLVLSKQLNFKSAVIRSNRSSCCSEDIKVFSVPAEWITVYLVHWYSHQSLALLKASKICWHNRRNHRQCYTVTICCSRGRTNCRMHWTW